MRSEWVGGLLPGGRSKIVRRNNAIDVWAVQQRTRHENLDRVYDGNKAAESSRRVAAPKLMASLLLGREVEAVEDVPNQEDRPDVAKVDAVEAERHEKGQEQHVQVLPELERHLFSSMSGATEENIKDGDHTYLNAADRA